MLPLGTRKAPLGEAMGRALSCVKLLCFAGISFLFLAQKHECGDIGQSDMFPLCFLVLFPACPWLAGCPLTAAPLWSAGLKAEGLRKEPDLLVKLP